MTDCHLEHQVWFLPRRDSMQRKEPSIKRGGSDPKWDTQFNSVQSLSRVWLYDPMNRSMPGLPVHQKLPEFTQTHAHRVGDAIQPSHPLSSPSPPAPIPPSIRVFSNESTLHIRWQKHWSFSFNISPSNEHPGLISFRMDWLDLLAVQGTLKSLLQHHSIVSLEKTSHAHDDEISRGTMFHLRKNNRMTF